MMDNFSYSRPASLKDASSQLGKEFGKVSIIAGGTDILGEMKDNLTSPDRLVPIRHLAELQGIKATAAGLRIGAATLLVDVVENPMVQERAPLLAMAAGKIGTPQIRNMGTIGGNLCHFPCYKHGGNTCFSAAGENDYHAILEGGPSYIVHPSDSAPALVALGATARIANGSRERTVPMEKFWVMAATSRL